MSLAITLFYAYALYSIGFVQEYKAEKTMDSLRQLSSPTAVVTRDGQPVIVPSKHVVPGDVVQIKAGDVIPADVSTLLPTSDCRSHDISLASPLPRVQSRGVRTATHR